MCIDKLLYFALECKKHYTVTYQFVIVNFKGKICRAYERMNTLLAN